MTYLIGTDEAGYGPNLGPLVIAATVWHVPDSARPIDLYQRLAQGVCATPQPGSDPRLHIADSKVVYKPGLGLAGLERTVLAVACAARRLSCTLPLACGDLWALLHGGVAGDPLLAPWPMVPDAAVPAELPCERIDVAREDFAETSQAAGVTFETLRVIAIFPEHFNEALIANGNKGTSLSRWTIGLLSRLIAEFNDEPVIAWCDKHGGRNKYGRLLQEQFPDDLVEVRQESAEESRYRWGPAERSTEVRFCVRGETHLPVALASMTAKYLRELSMRAFNAFWQSRVENLRPTAGYPGDSRRFHDDIRAAQAALGVADEVLWRTR